MENYYKQFDTCRQNEPPFCTDSCPFHMDVPDFEAKMERGRYNGAYKILRNGVAFPDIVAALCPQYCTVDCPVEDKIQINLLEKTCVAKAGKKDPVDYNLPARNHSVAVVGAGISGLACVLRLASKKYHVTIYERADRIGGQLWNLLPPELFMADIERQFQFEDYTLHLNTEVKHIETLSEYDAVYVATGQDGSSFGVDHFSSEPVIFTGGGLLGKDPIHALADGLKVAKAIESYLRGGTPEYPKENEASKVLVTAAENLHSAAVTATDNSIFSDEEVPAETGRCIKCQCNACMHYCDLSDFTNKWPLQMRDEIMTTTMSSESMIHKTPAIRLINMCTQCNLCDEGCPSQIQLGQMLREARKKLHKQDKMPGIYHQFWLRDMEFANGPFAALAKKAPEKDQCGYAFFPGCHLGAADPRYVLEPYRALLKRDPEVGLLLQCCGVPADWAGNEELHHLHIEKLRDHWAKLGKPKLILACPSCARHLEEFLPEIETVFLYELLDQWGIDGYEAEGTYSVFDPCSARNKSEVCHAVRNLARKAGVKLEELSSGTEHGCCGFGGHMSIANPKMAKQTAQKRSALSEHPYITYCINCRDVFRDEGKPVLHILDILFNIKSGEPDVTTRRQNRVELKAQLLKEIWGEEMKEKPQVGTLKLAFSPEVRTKMDKLKILEEDVHQVVEASLRTKRRTFDEEKKTYKCYKELGHITCWVEYAVSDDVYSIVNVYIHRMKIELEAVWNGRKTETDL